MGNFKKFLKNKNTVTILGILACLVILYIGYTMRINSKTALVDVCYANQTIQPKTKIKSEMVSRTSVPTSFILGSYYKCSDIIGKYSNYNTVIAEGSLFYLDLLVEEENLPDAMLYDINEGERLVSFAVNNESTYGNSLMPSNLVDVYVKYIDTKTEKVIYGEFFDKVEILAVKDSTGNNVFDTTDEERTPAYVYFSLNEVKYLLFESLQYIREYNGAAEIEIVLVPNTKEYKENEFATEVYSSDLYQFVLNQLSTIDEQRDLYNKLLDEMETLEQKRKEEANKQNTKPAA